MLFCIGANVQMSCLIWGFFYSFDDFFFNALMKYNHSFFPLFFCKILVSCFFKKKRKVFSCWFVKRRFYEWMGLFVGWVVGEFFFFWFQFFWMELKKIYSMKEVFYVSFFIYRKHGWKKISRQNKRVWKKGMFIYKRLWYS